MLIQGLSSPAGSSAARREAKQQESRRLGCMAMWFPALLPLILPALLPLTGAEDPPLPCPWEMNKVKDIVEVNCTGKALSAVPSGLPKDTGILLLNANRLTSVSTTTFLPLPMLQDLDLSDNRLQTLHTGPTLPALRELLLSRNALKALPALQGLPVLARLALAHNNLQVLAPGAFRAVPRLEDLDLRGNQLQTLPEEAFADLRALKDLDLSDNLLEELPKGLLQDLEALETLWLSGNRLRTLPTDFFIEGHFFAYVFLTENPWHCDCSLVYLRSWILRNERSVYLPERGPEKTKVEVAPEKVLCRSPPEHEQKPVIHFKPDCGNVGDAEEEDYEYSDEEKTHKKHTMTSFPLTHPPIPEEHTTTAHALTKTPLMATSPPLSTPCSSRLSPSTFPAGTRAPSITIPAPASSTTTATSTAQPSQPPSTTSGATAAPRSTPHSSTTLISTTSLTTATSTILPSTSSHPQSTLAASTATSTLTAPRFSTSPTALPSTTTPGASSAIGTSPPPLLSTTLVVSNTTLPPHAPALPGPLDTTLYPQPSPLPPPLPLCPCSTPAQTQPVLRSQVGGKGPQWGQWVLSHCCLLHWVLYLACLALLLLSMLALACWLVWMCLVGWHNLLQTQEVQYPLLSWRESTESLTMHPSNFQSPLQRSTFCTIKEVELCPEDTTSYIYCTIKDLGIQHSPPAKSFCTTKELWVRHSPPSASFKPFSAKLMATNCASLRTPSAYSLDRGVQAIGAVSVKYAGNTL